MTDTPTLPAQFEFIRTLGRGGMATVYLVLDKNSGQQIALKQLAKDQVGQLNARKRFEKEFELLKQLDHPHIVRAYQFFEQSDGEIFMSMEYVDGSSLSDKIGQPFENFSFLDRTRVAYQIGLALQSAHAKGLIHRDLKPANVLLTQQNDVKLVDFGVARLKDDSMSMTKTGDMIGTPYYMAPEQIRHEEIDQRADIYSFGVLCFELYSGARPFEHETLFDITRSHLIKEAPKLRTINKDLPSWLGRMVEICLEKDPRDRYQSMDEITLLLKEQVEGKTKSSFFKKLFG